jgi:hypothetical protein
MLRLQTQVQRCWLAANESRVTLCREHGPEVDFEPFLVDLGPALVSVRAIDEAFTLAYPRVAKNGADSSPYAAHALRSPQGRASVGLVVLRNAEIHDSVSVDPEIVRVIGGPGGTGRAFPAWRGLMELTTEARDQGKWRHASYESDVAGRLVIETLLDAIAFFDSCDPAIARRTDDGELEGFPLPRLVEFGYERRHPDWPRREKADEDLRVALASAVPGGHRREVVAVLRDEAGNVEAFCGWTVTKHGGMSFVESPEQVESDMAQGYVYGTSSDHRDAYDLSIPLTPFAIDAATELPDADADSDASWRRWWDTSRDDVGFYKSQRRPL